MKIIVTGGRNFFDYGFVSESLKKIEREFSKKISMIVHGGCTGADDMAQRYAFGNGINQKIYRADWKRLGIAAGPMRNKQMIEENKDATVVVVFPGGKGTANAIMIANKSGMLVRAFEKL